MRVSENPAGTKYVFVKTPLGRRALGSRTNLALLQKVDDVLQSSKLGIGTGQLAKISQVHLATGAACGTCINSFDKTLDNIKNIENYIDKPEDFVKVLTNLTNNTNNFRGADWALQVVKEKPVVGKITGFEVKLNDAENFTADIISENSKGVKYYYECKNYSGTANYLIGSGSNFIDQFANYLTKSTNLDQVNYFFHSRYAGDLKADVIAALISTKGRDALNPLILNGKLQSLFSSSTIINSTDDFINQINKPEIFNAIFK